MDRETIDRIKGYERTRVLQLIAELRKHFESESNDCIQHRDKYEDNVDNDLAENRGAIAALDELKRRLEEGNG